MLIVNDFAFHQGTKVVGKVIGYGYRMVNNSYLQTLKVLVSDISQSGKKHAIAEDLSSRPMPIK